MRSAALCVILVPAVLSLVGCGGSSPTAPSSPATSLVSVTSALVLVDGHDVSGGTVPQGQHGSMTRFQAMLQHSGTLEPGFEMWLRFQQPGEHGMMGRQGLVRLYDDGTHGDPVAGDGIYGLDDTLGDVGCQGPEAPMGGYHYDFYGMGSHGDETNHRIVTVTVVPH